MKSHKELLNALSEDKLLRQLTDEEVKNLREVFISAYADLARCCEKYGLTVMLVYGSAIGAVRHKGFIPWDDDMDVAMPRADFEKLKEVFDSELGDKYILSSPNYKGNAINRFPVMMVRGTRLEELGSVPGSELAKIKIDIFIIENIPQNRIVRFAKGLLCTGLMFMASYEDTFEHRNEVLKNYMCKTREGRSAYYRRILVGKAFSVISFQKWMDMIDKACRYRKMTKLVGIPTGRDHYFGEVRPRSVYFPVTTGEFEGLKVNIPGSTDEYLTGLYGPDYMTLPPEEKRERHFIIDIGFDGQ